MISWNINLSLFYLFYRGPIGSYSTDILLCLLSNGLWKPKNPTDARPEHLCYFFYNLFCWERTKGDGSEVCVWIIEACSQDVIQNHSGNFSLRGLWGTRSAAAESITSALVFTHRPVTEMTSICVYLGSSRQELFKEVPLVCCIPLPRPGLSRCDQVKAQVRYLLQILVGLQYFSMGSVFSCSSVLVR